MGLYGALIVVPERRGLSVTAAHCAKGVGPFSLGASGYDHPATCYDREYLFQFSEVDARIHRAAKEQSDACAALGATRFHPSA